MMSPFSTLVLVSLAASPSLGAYTLQREYSGNNFLSGFEFRTAADYPGSGDPTGGFVNYVSQSVATQKGLAKVVNGQVWVGADSNSTISTSSQGRNSVRLESTDSFSGGLLIADLAHMPGNACGIWPAFWTYNFDEDPYGEVDIVEGVMLQPDNIVSLHTCGLCSFDFGSRSDCSLAGSSTQCDDDHVTNSDGCGETGPRGSYGDRFNALGGGVYATEILSSSIKIWYFANGSVPADITAGKPDPSKWSAPFVNGQKSSNGCNVGNYFKKQTIIINITFCGASIDQDTWDSESSCSSKASTCASFVAKNPSAFKEAYWLFNSIRLYQ